MESLLFLSCFFSFKSPNVFCSFYITMLKFVNDFSKGAICGIPSTLGSNQNHYQGNTYVYSKLKLFSI